MNKCLLFNYSHLLLCIALLISTQSFGSTVADITVRGVVTDEAGTPLPGATVLEKETTNGVVTDVDGKFTLTVDEGATLVVSYVGYLNHEEAVDGRTSLTIALKNDLEALEEVVVVGYGTQRREDLTGSVASIAAEDFSDFPITESTQAIKGLAAGVAVSQNSGAPGGDYRIRIRGANSLFGSNDPLIVLDGIPSNINLADLNPADVASIQILKDASSTAVFGSRGANGVVLVETKSGAGSQGLRVQYNPFVTLKHVNSGYDKLSAGNYARVLNQSRTGQSYTAEEVSAFDQNGGTDWQEETTRPGFLQNHQLSISGGTKNLNVYMSGNYTTEEGVVINTNYERFSYRLNVDGEVTSFLRAGLNLGLIEENRTNIRRGNYNELYNALNWSPTEPIYNGDGTYNQVDNFGALRSPFAANPVMQLLELNEDGQSASSVVSAFIEVDILPSLTFKTLLGINNDQNNFRRFQNEFVSPSSVNNAFQANSKNRFWQFTTLLTYQPTIGTQHDLKLTAGFERSKNQFESFNAEASGFTTASVGYNNMSLGLNPVVDSDQSGFQLQSYFGRANYQFDDRYLLTATLRADGSSKFRGDNQYSYFPSVGLGWNISNESFFPTSKAINLLKVRASYGLTGNQAIGPYATLAALEEISFRYGTVENFPGFTLDGASNPNLRWETTRTLDMGLDMSLLNNSLSVSLSYFNKETVDLLQSVPIPDYNGGGSIIDNVGEMTNQGIELSIGGSPVSTSQFLWSSSFNLTYTTNEVTNLGDVDTLFLDTENIPFVEDVTYYVLAEGAPLGSFYGFRYDGLYQSADEAAQFGRSVGDTRYRDINGDGEITGEDQEIIGSAIPKWRLGFNNTLEYKNLRLNVFLEGVFDFEVFNYPLSTSTNPRSFGGGRSITLEEGRNFWTADSPDAEYPNPLSTTEQAFSNSSRWLEKGDFVRINNITLSYRMPSQVMSRLLSDLSLEFYASAQNIATFTAVTGADPESSSALSEEDQPDNNPGFIIGTYPRTASYTLGLRLGLN